MRRTSRIFWAALGLVGLAACVDTDFSGGTAGGKKAGKNEKSGSVNDGPGGTGTGQGINENGSGPQVGSGGGTEGGGGTGGLGSDVDTGSWDPGRVNADADVNDQAQIRIMTGDFRGGSIVKRLDANQRSHIWIAMASGDVTYLQLEGLVPKVQKTWTGVTGGGGGTRTYVTEGGAAFTRTGGHVYFIDPDSTPVGAIDKTATSKNYKKIAVSSGDERTCVVSYRKGGKRYLGMGHSYGEFVEYEMEDVKPFYPKWAAPSRTGKAGSSRWGYNCFVDQDRLLYYGNWYAQAVSQMQGVKLGDAAIVAMTPSTTAPNAAFSATSSLGNANLSARSASIAGSYAVAGDREGNILNGNDYYTYAHEPTTDTVWGAPYSRTHMNIFPRKCFSTLATCTGQASFTQASLSISDVGPVSSLGGGYMVGMQRHGNTVYVMWLKDPADLTKGVNAQAVATVPGSGGGYMYTDFTGATLYLTDALNTFDLTTDPKFSADRGNRGVGFTWLNKAGKATEWKDIKFEIRCYTAGETSDFVTVPTIKNATEQTFITVEPCVGKKYNRVDVRLTQLNNGDSLMGVKKIQVVAYQ